MLNYVFGILCQVVVVDIFTETYIETNRMNYNDLKWTYFFDLK